MFVELMGYSYTQEKVIKLSYSGSVTGHFYCSRTDGGASALQSITFLLDKNPSIIMGPGRMMLQDVV